MTPASPRPEVPEHLHRLGRVHHVAVVVRDLEAALRFYRDVLGLELEVVEEIPSDRVRIAFLPIGETKIELVSPTDDLAEALTRLGIEGIELIDSAPRRGAEGPVAFLHPRSCHGVLVELIEATGGPAWDALGYR